MAAYSMFQRIGGRIVTDLSFSNYAAFFSKPHHLNALVNSVEVTLITTVISILLAYPLAYILAYRVPARWQRIALMMAILPFWTSYVVRSYSWLLVLSNNGVISNVLQWLGMVADPISLANSRTATVIGFVHNFSIVFPLAKN
jgi:spermidine/putrescine transport system permease protein